MIRARVLLFTLFAASTSSCAPSGFKLNRGPIKAASPVASSAPADWKFWWGISTASYQFEDPGPPEENLGFKTDWDLWAAAGRLREPRGNATWSYTETDRDIAALRHLGVTHLRFSVEWARVEPSPGQFNEAAIQHYVRYARDLKKAGITPIVALWHFTFPSWLSGDDADHHGWMHPDVVARWGEFIRHIAAALAPEVQYFVPESEPNSWALAVLVKYFPVPGRASYSRYLRTQDIEATCFLDAAKIIREIRPDARIISIHSIIHWQPDALDFFNFWYHKALEYNYYHLDKVVDACDLIGINYYYRETASPLARAAQAKRTGEGVSDQGWIIDAGGLEAEIRAAARRYGKPILITENGICDRTDLKRQRYVVDHVQAVRRAIDAGFDVRGYFHWSLIDNYEWADGYRQKFGLFSMDPTTRALVPKKSASFYRSLITGKPIDEPLQTIPATASSKVARGG